MRVTDPAKILYIENYIYVLRGIRVHWRLSDFSCKPFPSTGDLPKQGIEPRSPVLQAELLPTEPLGKPNVQ